MPLKRPPEIVTCCSRMPWRGLPIRRIDIADDAGDAARLPVFARCAHRSDAVDKLGLAQRFQLLRPVGPATISRQFLEQVATTVVTAADIGEQILEQVAVRCPADPTCEWCGSTIGKSGSRISSRRLSSQSCRIGDVTAGGNRGLGHGAVLPGLLFDCANSAPPRRVMPRF